MAASIQQLSVKYEWSKDATQLLKNENIEMHIPIFLNWAVSIS